MKYMVMTKATTIELLGFDASNRNFMLILNNMNFNKIL